MLKQSFVSIYKPIMEKKGFLQKKGIFHKCINNEIIQMLSFVEFEYEFTIQFTFFPICSGYSCTTFLDEYRIGSLLGNESYAMWKKNENLELNIKKSLDICSEYLFPYFEKVKDCKTYSISITELYKQIYDEGYKDILLTHNILYNVSLKIGNYDLAKKCIYASIEQKENSLKRNLECGIQPTEKKIKEIESFKIEKMNMLKAIELNDRNFINNYILSNEKKTLNSYKKNFKKFFL